MSEPEPESKSEPQEIRDPEAYVNHRRLRSIFDIRDDMVEARKKVKLAGHSREFTTYEALSAYRALTDSYVVEAEPLLRRYEGGIELLEKVDFGTETASPPYHKMSRGQRGAFEVDLVNHDRDTVRLESPPQEKEYNLNGLLSVIECPDPLVAEYEWRSAQRSNRGGGTVNYVHKQQISFSTLDRMVRSLNNFLAEIGFELDPQDDTEPGQIEDVGL
jgi:hypothetical protein